MKIRDIVSSISSAVLIVLLLVGIVLYYNSLPEYKQSSHEPYDQGPLILYTMGEPEKEKIFIEDRGVTISVDSNEESITILGNPYTGINNLSSDFLMRNEEAVFVSTWDDECHNQYIIQNNQLQLIYYQGKYDDVLKGLELESEPFLPEAFTEQAYAEIPFGKLLDNVDNLEWKSMGGNVPYTFSSFIPHNLELEFDKTQISTINKIIRVEPSPGEYRYLLCSPEATWYVHPNCPLDNKGNFHIYDSVEINIGGMKLYLDWAHIKMPDYKTVGISFDITNWEDCINRTPDEIFPLGKRERGD